jgi:Putative viral replication protein.
MTNIKKGANDGSNTRGGGNTKPPRVRDIPGKYWCFTLNNWTIEEVAQMALDFSLFCNKWIYGKEIGENDTPHLQGFLVLNTKDRLSGIKKKFGNRYHFEKMKGTEEEAVRYCCKDGDITYGDSIFPDCWLEKPKLQRNVEDTLIKKENFFPWQKEISDIINNNEIDDRSIYWIWESQGNQGKTAFTKFQCYNNNALLIRKGKMADIMNSAFNYKNELRLIICDIPRCSGNSISTSAIESLKDGIIINTKYETGQVIIPSPKIIIFSNYYPETSGLSKDRWKIRKIVDKVLVNQDMDLS